MADAPVMHLTLSADESETHWKLLCEQAPYLAHLPKAITGELYAAADGEGEEFEEQVVEKEILIKLGLVLSAQSLGPEMEKLFYIFDLALGTGAEMIIFETMQAGYFSCDHFALVGRLLVYSAFGRISLDLDATEHNGLVDDHTGFYKDIHPAVVSSWVEKALNVLDGEHTDLPACRRFCKELTHNIIFDLTDRDKSTKLH